MRFLNYWKPFWNEGYTGLMNINHPGRLAVFAIVLFVGAYAAGYFAPRQFLQPPKTEQELAGEGTLAVFVCPAGRAIAVEFRKRDVRLALSDGRTMTLPQTISASGARYASADESFVFWNKGDGAFVQEEGDMVTYGECVGGLK